MSKKLTRPIDIAFSRFSEQLDESIKTGFLSIHPYMRLVGKEMKIPVEFDPRNTDPTLIQFHAPRKGDKRDGK